MYYMEELPITQFRIQLTSTLQCRKRSAKMDLFENTLEWSDLKTMLFENTVFLVWIVKQCYLKMMMSPQQHNQVVDHSNMSIQDGRQMLSGGFRLVDHCDF